ncbi:hydrogenase expression/formation protein HypE [Clostridium rectalis]|uniref:hydrogenase expression/formation protein HypE n=1 Tax=Clostridium rectalis TaxID=2040295 RepID=UPI003C12C11E
MDTIGLIHGEGGKFTQKLIKDIFYKKFDNPILVRDTDSALINLYSKEIAFTTDSFVVNPIFFRGGDIGKLSVSGTINDLISCGAEPKYLSLALIIEEGFSVKELTKIVNSIKETSILANVHIVTGDTKVVPKGKADGIFINTTGIGYTYEYKPKNIENKDKIIITGTIAEHGTAIAVDRYNLKVKGNIKSDCMPLNYLTKYIKKYYRYIKFMRDPTRGGVGQVLNELSKRYGLGVRITKDSIPIRQEVEAINDMLGINPLYLACEGRMIIVVDKNIPLNILEQFKKEISMDAAVIGEFTDKNDFVYIENYFGGKRVLGELDTQILPRIC